MISFIKKGAILLLAFFAFNTVKAQTNIIVSLDNMVQLDPILIGGITRFQVQVTVDDTSAANADSLYGNLGYYYQTDFMISEAIPARFIDDDTANLWLVGTFLDTAFVDVQPGEVQTSPPVNLIILWPAIMDPWPIAPDTTDSVTLTTFDAAYVGIPTIPTPQKSNVIFPVPAKQFIYVKPEEIELIKQIQILTMDGKLVSTHEYLEYKSGFIGVDTLPAGNYLVELNYKNGETFRTKIIKY